MSSNKTWEDFEASQDKRTPLKDMQQRLTRGFTDHEVQMLGGSIIQFVAPRLNYFFKWQSEHGKAVPPEFETNPVAWLEVLQKMDYAFRTISTKDVETAEEKAQIIEGFKLFGEYLPFLRG